MNPIQNRAPKTPAIEAVAKIAESGQAALDNAINKVFADEAAPAATAATEPKPADAKPPGDEKPPGETVDLSQQAKPAPNAEEPKPGTEPTAEEIAAEAVEAKDAGMSVEDYRTAKAAEQSRLDDISAKTGETAEQIYEREEKEGKPTDLEAAAKPAKTFSQEEVDGFVKKRVKNLESENAQLKERLEQIAKRPETASSNPLLDVTDEAKLAEVAATARKGLREADGMLDDLRFDEEGVRERLTKSLGDRAASTDLSVKGMAKILRQAKESLNATLEAVPDRKEFIEAAAKAEPIAKAVFPWLNDPEDERTVQMNELARTMPSFVKATPDWKYWMGHALTGHLAALEAMKRSQGGGKAKGPAVKLRIKSKMPGTGGAGGAVKQPKNTFAAAKAKGDVDAMAEALFNS